MSNALQAYEQKQLAKVTEKKSVPDFQAGDTVRVNVRIVEGKTERVQAFEGLCIAKRNRGINSAFTVRKISHGEGVERVFPMYSPRIDSIEVVRRGVVRRAKLYYMRQLTGKAARIKEKRDFSAEANSQSKEEKRKKRTEERQKAKAEKLAAKQEKKKDKTASENK